MTTNETPEVDPHPKHSSIEVSQELSSTDVPDDLGSLSVQEVTDMCVEVAAGFAQVQTKLRDHSLDAAERDRLKSIRDIKRGKLDKVFGHLKERMEIALPEDLSLPPYVVIHRMLRSIIALTRTLKSSGESVGATHPLFRGYLKIQNLLGNMSQRIGKEFGRRKSLHLDRGRFVVGVSGAEPSELEDYLNGVCGEHLDYWPAGMVYADGKLLVVWRTKEPMEPQGTEGVAMGPFAVPPAETS